MKQQRQQQDYIISTQQVQNNVPPSHQKIHKKTSKITTSDKDYYYCICEKVRRVRFHKFYIILIEDKIKKTSFIYSYEFQHAKLNNSIDDLAFLTKLFGGIELAVMKSTQTIEDLRFNIQFKDKQQKLWQIQMQNNDVRNFWISLIDEKIKQIKYKSPKPEKLQKKKQIPENQKQIQKNITYSKHKQINTLVSKQFNNVKTMITSLLNQSTISEQDKKQYLNDKMNLYEGNFTILGSLIDSIDEKFIEQIRNLHDNQQKYIQQTFRLQTEIQTLRTQTTDKIAELQQKDIINRSRISQLAQENKSLKSQIKKLSQEQNQLQVIMNELKSSKNDLTMGIKSKQSQCFSLKKQISTLQQALVKEKTDMKNYTQEYLHTVKEKNTLIDNIKEKLTQKDRSLQEYKQNLSRIEERLKLSIEQCQKVRVQVSQLKKTFTENEYLHIFHGDLLGKLSFYKTFMKEQLQKYTQKQIFMTKILFKFDQMSKINFHTYVDNHSNVCLIIKTSNGSYFAAFTQDPFSPNSVATKGGIIISLTNRKIFTLQQQKKSVTYDQYYLIFGNSEVRLKSLEQKVFCNFGISNGFFNTNGCKVDVLLNDDINREVDIEGYQIHQIFFKQ